MEETRIVISYKGVPNGIQNFDFVIGDPFFADLEYSEFEHGRLSVRVLLEKNDDVLSMDLSIDGEVEVSCDRCLDMFSMPVHFEGKLYASQHVDTIDDSVDTDIDTIEVNASRMEIDLTHYIYESICLSMPMQRIHPQDEHGVSGCNVEMMKILESHLSKED
ncbi:MAG: DUF177 domain-containing protein [Bacteroidales bacterium]|nr:DUF177 domain-containing protein [Bacteroidales bacterium]